MADSLTSWAQAHLAPLYEHSTASDNQAEAAPSANHPDTFYSAYSPKAEVIVNYTPVPTDAHKDDLARRSFGSMTSTVEWKDVIEVPADSEKPNEAGIVAGFFVVTHHSKLRIRAAPAETKTFVAFNAKIEQDPSVAVEAGSDPRRIAHMFQTTVTKATPIHLGKMAGHKIAPGGRQTEADDKGEAPEASKA